ncbi:hypothetical protein [Mucilaginibacter sp.]|uniref:hypothetical protein n=1 Tax=Mucilaginibacter sp. TaxID=1882438 RepID=UPI003D113A83
MLTLNQIKQRFIEFFEGHSQINTVIYADDFDFAAYPDILYKVVHIQPVNSYINGNEIIHQFKLMVADIEDPNFQSSEDDIMSDCELIANDFLAFFGDDDYPDFLMDTDTTYQRFSESGTDRTAGVVFTTKVRQTREINPCTIPTKANLSGITSN